MRNLRSAKAAVAEPLKSMPTNWKWEDLYVDGVHIMALGSVGQFGKASQNSNQAVGAADCTHAKFHGTTEWQNGDRWVCNKKNQYSKEFKAQRCWEDGYDMCDVVVGQAIQDFTGTFDPNTDSHLSLGMGLANQYVNAKKDPEKYGKGLFVDGFRSAMEKHPVMNCKKTWEYCVDLSPLMKDSCEWSIQRHKWSEKCVRSADYFHRLKHVVLPQVNSRVDGHWKGFVQKQQKALGCENAVANEEKFGKYMKYRFFSQSKSMQKLKNNWEMCKAQFRWRCRWITLVTPKPRKLARGRHELTMCEEWTKNMKIVNKAFARMKSEGANMDWANSLTVSDPSDRNCKRKMLANCYMENGLWPEANAVIFNDKDMDLLY